ncbi:hypothetical protein ACSBR2_026938 [Camellia fascicularis]
MSSAPAPGMDARFAVSLPIFTAIVCSSVVLSLFALMKHLHVCPTIVNFIDERHLHHSIMTNGAFVQMFHVLISETYYK